MPSIVVVEIGPARSGKTRRLLTRYTEAIRGAGREIGNVLWIAPTGRNAATVRERLMASGVDAVLGPAVLTFAGLTSLILTECGERYWPVDETAMRRLVRRVIGRAQRAGQLGRFEPAAGSPGFVDAVVQHFTELKRREIEPHVMAQAPARRAQAEEDRILAELYADYQAMLYEHGLADQEGCHWIARDRLASGACASLANMSLVVVDGFTDFTPTQLEMLELLAKRSNELHLSLPLDVVEGEPGRGALFAKCAHTLQAIQNRLPNVTIRQNPAEPSTWAGRDYIAANLFRNPRRVARPDETVSQSLARCEIVAAAGLQDEIVQLARRIKTKLISGAARPDEIIVVSRVLTQGPRIGEVFEEFGIPFAIDARESLLTAPVVQALLGLLRLANENWPFRRVVSVLTNNSYGAIDERGRRAAEWLVRELQIANGREELFRRVDSLVALARENEGAAGPEQRVAVAETAQAALRQLAAALDELPEKSGLVEWGASLTRLGQQLGLPPLVEKGGATPQASKNSELERVERDLAAWQTIERQLGAMSQIDSRFGETPAALSRTEIEQLLFDIASHDSLPNRVDESGRVRVLSATAARTVTAKHVYLAGMSEQSFPLPEAGGRLYSEDDYRLFEKIAHTRPAGQADARKRLSAASPLGRSQDEMLLFYEVLTRAEETLTISYPALDDKAQTIPPSPYLAEIDRLLELHGLRISRVESDLSPAPRDASPQSWADWRVLAVDQALDGRPQLLAEFYQASAGKGELVASIEAGLRIIHDRSRRDEFSAAEGRLQSDAVRERLRRRFGPRHLWSPTQWERYAHCPYQFLLHDVLGLEPLGDLTLETDFGRRGGMLHNVLARFHREWNEQPANVRRSREAFNKRLLALVAEEAGRGAQFGVEAALVELDRRQLGKWVDQHYDHLHAYAATHEGFDAPLVPTHFELSFGSTRTSSDGEDVESTKMAFEFDLDGEKVFVTGRIDRIDVGKLGGQTVFSIIDYKTGKMTSLKQEHIESGERLQLSIYVAAAQALLFDGRAAPVAAGYWTMDRGFDAKSVLNVQQPASGKGKAGPTLEALQDLAARRVKQFVNDIRTGEFPVYSRDEYCTGRCEFHTVCRVAQVRSLGKSWRRD